MCNQAFLLTVALCAFAVLGSANQAFGEDETTPSAVRSTKEEEEEKQFQAQRDSFIELTKDIVEITRFDNAEQRRIVDLFMTYKILINQSDSSFKALLAESRQKSDDEFVRLVREQRLSRSSTGKVLWRRRIFADRWAHAISTCREKLVQLLGEEAVSTIDRRLFGIKMIPFGPSDIRDEPSPDRRHPDTAGVS